MSKAASDGLTIAHVGLTVSDLERSVRFYEEHFGFTCSDIIRIDAGEMRIGLLRSGDVVLELFAFGDTQPLPDYRRTLESDLRTIGTKHVAFAVADIITVHERLAAAGVTLATELRVFGSGQRYFFVADPDGILLEIMERTATTP